MRADLLGSYSMAETFAGILSLSLLKSIILYSALRRRRVAYGYPSVGVSSALSFPCKKALLGSFLVISSNVDTDINLLAGDVGLYFFTDFSFFHSFIMLGISVIRTSADPISPTCPKSYTSIITGLHRTLQWLSCISWR